MANIKAKHFMQKLLPSTDQRQERHLKKSTEQTMKSKSYSTKPNKTPIWKVAPHNLLPKRTRSSTQISSLGMGQMIPRTHSTGQQRRSWGQHVQLPLSPYSRTTRPKSYSYRSIKLTISHIYQTPRLLDVRTGCPTTSQRF
jgi:hypothetical protein